MSSPKSQESGSGNVSPRLPNDALEKDNRTSDNNNTTPGIAEIPLYAFNKSINLERIKKLSYKICDVSSFQPQYVQQNILCDCPTNNSLGWTSINNIHSPRYLTLKLRKPAIVSRIKFGKYENCNIRKFRIYGGLSQDRLGFLLESELRNDQMPQTFSIRSNLDNSLPILYLKIVPITNWVEKFSYRISYFEVFGLDDHTYTCQTLPSFYELKESEIVRLCLKHFREQGYQEAFKALQHQTNVYLEDPCFTGLHQVLVEEGNFQKAEEMMNEYITGGLIDEYIKSQIYKYAWRSLDVPENQRPSQRGGHQLVIDGQKRLMYLFGGFNGDNDVSDLWQFDIEKKSWTLLCDKSENFNGPSPRSCHKMVFDPITNNIFILGRYRERSFDHYESDFYRYDTCTKNWFKICDDTSAVHGPQLCFEHQMCIDVDKCTIYVYGGKNLKRRTGHSQFIEPSYSGLFSYHIPTNTWNEIFVDTNHPSATLPGVISIKSRFNHCMVFHNKQRKLYIYGGERHKDKIDNFITYDVDTKNIEILDQPSNSSYDSDATDLEFEDLPPTTAIRGTIDIERNEIYIFSSISKLKELKFRELRTTYDAMNSLWVYSLNSRNWARIYTRHYNYVNNLATDDRDYQVSKLEPFPRFAHQFVYDEVDKLHYLVGGNPGSMQSLSLRLDDIWILNLKKPKHDDILLHCKFLLRKLQYEEMVKLDRQKALEYLRTKIAEVIDHNDKQDLQNFHRLACVLFKIEDDIEKEDSSFNSLPDKSNSDVISSLSNEKDATAEDCPMGSFDNTTSSDIVASQVASNYGAYRKSGGKRSRTNYFNEIHCRRSFLYSKLLQLFSPKMVQPSKNLVDFIL